MDSLNITPEVGSRLWYWPSNAQRAFMAKFSDKPLAATILCPWSDTCVNLEVIDHSGNRHFLSSAQLRQPGMDRDAMKYGYAEWSPFQIAQAEQQAGINNAIAKTTTFGSRGAQDETFLFNAVPKADPSPRPAGLTFGEAIEELKRGYKVSRAGWNGKGMYLWLMPGAMVKSEWCKEPHLKKLADENGGEIDCLGTIRMFTVNAEGRRAVLTGWLASQSDMLAEDWVLL